jgi:hypothetical protein
MDNSQLIFENDDNFSVILIKPTDIDHLDWLHENYTLQITELNCYDIINTSKNNFLEMISDKLNLSKFKDKTGLEVTTQVICEIPNYIYELIYVDELTEKDDVINNVASLLNTNGNKVYGNAILMKTNIPSLSKSILITNVILSNIKDILDGRVKTNVVIYDGEWSNKIVSGNLEDFANSFFDETIKKFETPFLLHNINIWYEPCDGCSTKTCGKVLERPIYKCIWFTMITDEFRGSIYLDEVKKIIDISNKMDFPFNPKPEWMEDEKDQFTRQVIKNKYKILDLAYNELC